MFKTVENVTFTFHAVLWPSKHQSHPSFYIKISRYLVCCFFPSKYVFCSTFCNLTFNCAAAPIFLHFNLEKHHSCFTFIFLTTFDLFHCLFLLLYTLNTYTVTFLLVDIVQRRNCYLSVMIFTSLNISGVLFVVCLNLNTLFLLFFAA